MSYIHLAHLSFHYDNSDEMIFEDVTLHLDSRWHLGLVGRNGRGKTTLLKLIHGDLKANGALQKDVKTRYFPYPVKDPTKQTADIVTEIIGDLDWRVYKELNLLKVDASVLFQPYQTLSPGEQTKILLACLFIHDDDFVLIDEPTNHLDEDGRALVSAYLQNKQGFILVSHDRAFLDDCIDHVLAINKNSIALTQGNLSTYLENRSRQEHDERMRQIHLKKDIARLQQAAGKTAVWSDRVEKSKIGAADKGYVGHMAAKMMKRSKTIEKRYERYIEEKKSLLRDSEEIEELKLHPCTGKSGRIIALDEVSVCYGSKTVLSHFRLTVNSGQKICLRGANGAGKSTVLKLLAGLLKPNSGKVLASNDLKIAYAFQDTMHLTGSFQDYLTNHQIDGVLCRAILHKLGFHQQLFTLPLENLSQGQKKKVVLAGVLAQSADLYLFDEPLNYIDLDSRMQLEKLLKKTTMTCVFVEHDRAFCQAVATETYTFLPKK